MEQPTTPVASQVAGTLGGTPSATPNEATQALPVGPDELEKYKNDILLELGQCTLLAIRHVFEGRCATYEYPVAVDGTNFIVQARRGLGKPSASA